MRSMDWKLDPLTRGRRSGCGLATACCPIGALVTSRSPDGDEMTRQLPAGFQFDYMTGCILCIKYSKLNYLSNILFNICFRIGSRFRSLHLTVQFRRQPGSGCTDAPQRGPCAAGCDNGASYFEDYQVCCLTPSLPATGGSAAAGSPPPRAGYRHRSGASRTDVRDIRPGDRGHGADLR